MLGLPENQIFIPEANLWRYFRSCLNGLDYLHNIARVIHCDIKPENILVDSSDNLKISDFGISQIMESDDNKLNHVGGTRMFHPPEVYQLKPFNGALVDIWALGVTFYYLAYGKYPFFSRDGKKFQEIVENVEEEYPEGVISEDFKNLIKKCLTKDTSGRSSLAKLFTDPWVTKRGEVLLKMESMVGC